MSGHGDINCLERPEGVAYQDQETHQWILRISPTEARWWRDPGQELPAPGVGTTA